MTHRIVPRLVIPLVTLLLLLAVTRDADARGAMVAGRPLHLHVPSTLGSGPAPLVILLHGMTATSTFQEKYMLIAEQADRHGFLYAYPDGLRGPAGQFWNGANCCQDPLTAPVDDVAYIDAIIEHVRRNHNVDERRIFLIGHSNGAFMASRYACERTGVVAAIVTLGGGTYRIPTHCGPLSPWPPFLPAWNTGRTSVLHIHGTRDEVSPYYWSWTMFLPFGTAQLPSAAETITTWGYRNGCLTTTYPPPIDLVATAAGAETSPAVHHCLSAAVELWTMNDSPHIPNFHRTPVTATFGAHAVTWLLAHGR